MKIVCIHCDRAWEHKFAWLPLRLADGGWAWLTVVRVDRGYQCGDTPTRRGGRWVEYRAAIAKATGDTS